MSKHHPAPWAIFTDGEPTEVFTDPGDADGFGCSWLTCSGPAPRETLEANAARIVACVNALDGIDDPEAFVWRAATNEHLLPVLLEALRGMIGAYSGHGVGGVAEEQSADESIAALETAIALVRSSQKALDSVPPLIE